MQTYPEADLRHAINAILQTAGTAIADTFEKSSGGKSICLTQPLSDAAWGRILDDLVKAVPGSSRMDWCLADRNDIWITLGDLW